MSKLKYIGLDVHQASISVAVLDESGKLVVQSVVATRATSESWSCWKGCGARCK